MSIATGLTLHSVENTFRELVDEICVEVIGKYVKFHTSPFFATWFYNSDNVTETIFGWLADDAIDVDGTVILAPESDVECQSAEQAIIHGKVFDVQEAVNARYIAEVAYLDFACSKSSEFDVMEVNDAENVLEIYTL